MPSHRTTRCRTSRPRTTRSWTVRPGRAVAVAGLAALLAVTGCSSSFSRAAPSSSASAAGALPSGEAVPTLGPVGPEAAAPVAAVRAYYAALSQGTNSGTVAQVRQLATTECLCQKVVDVLETYFRAGQTFKGYDFAVDGVTAAQVQDGNAAVRISYTVAAYDSYQGGKKVSSDKARSGEAVIGLQQVDDRWLISTVDNLPAASAAPA